MERMKAEHRIVGDVRAKGCLMGIELVKDRATALAISRPMRPVPMRPSRMVFMVASRC
jgi:4-aminobutyrate aminotransferase-like enzyme